MARHGRQMNLPLRGGGPRRATQWISKKANFQDFTSAESARIFDFTQAELAMFVPCTIIRTVGMMVVASDLNFITNQVYSGAVGGCLIREDAGAAGVFPDAFSNSGDDVWFWHQFFAMQIDDRADSDIKTSERYVIDSRAQRKVVD